MDIKKIGFLLGSLTLLLSLSVGTAFAGPSWQFGPDDEGVLKLDYKGQFQFKTRDSGSGANGGGSTSEFNFRRNRLSLTGAWDDYLGIYVQTEYMEDNNIGTLSVGDGDNSDFKILDAQIRFKYNNQFRARVGKFKYNFTRENLEACFMPLSLDRSLFIRAPLVDEGTRDKGGAVWGNLFNNKFQYRADVMNGRNDSVSSPDSEFRYSVRAHVSLLDPEKSYGYRGTYLGKKKVLTIGAAYQLENNIAYEDTVTQTGKVDYSAYTVDLFAEYPVEEVGTFTFSAAYVDYDLDDAYKGANPDPEVIALNGEKNGGYVKVGYMLPNLPLQFFARGENWSFSSLNGIYDQEVDWYGGGLNYYFRGQNLKLTAEYARNDFDKEGTVAGVTTEDFDTFALQVQVLF